MFTLSPEILVLTFHYSYKVLRASNAANNQHQNKKKTEEPKKTQSTVIFPNVYRPKEQLAKFMQQDDESFETDEENSDSSENEISDDDSYESSVTSKTPPRMANPFDFPTLPEVSKKIQSRETSFVDTKLMDVTVNPPQPTFSSTPIKVRNISPQIIQVPSKFVDISRPQPLEESSMTLPKFTIDNKLFFSLYPEVVFDEKIQARNEILDLNDHYLVKLTVVHSPMQFYFELINNQHSYFMNKMRKVYDASRDVLAISSNDIKLGMLVAVEVGTWWLRAKILCVPNQKNLLKVVFIDSGVEHLVDLSSVCFLIKDFIHHPVNVHKGRRSNWNERLFDDSASRNFFKVVADKILSIKFKNFDHTRNVYEIEFN